MTPTCPWCEYALYLAFNAPSDASNEDCFWLCPNGLCPMRPESKVFNNRKQAIEAARRENDDDSH